jgi:hypothetical protein
MNNLEKLIEQKKEIEKKIKDIEMGNVTYQHARLRSNSRNDEYSIDICPFGDSKQSWKKVAIGKDRDEAIKHLDTLILCLTRLRQKIEKGM